MKPPTEVRVHRSSGVDHSCSRKIESRDEAPRLARCELGCGEACAGEIPAHEGYVYRGKFYCDSCVWKLAQNGEFYCG